MLKTNCKAVKEKIKNYVMESYSNWYADNAEYTEKKLGTFKEVANFIIKSVLEQKGFNRKQVNNIYSYHKAVASYYGSFQNQFVEWCQGLPSILNCYYYYNVNAIDLLGEWLEETETEKKKYTEEQAETLITKLLYRDLIAQVDNIDNLIIEVLGL